MIFSTISGNGRKRFPHRVEKRVENAKKRMSIDISRSESSHDFSTDARYSLRFPPHFGPIFGKREEILSRLLTHVFPQEQSFPLFLPHFLLFHIPLFPPFPHSRLFLEIIHNRSNLSTGLVLRFCTRWISGNLRRERGCWGFPTFRHALIPLLLFYFIYLFCIAETLRLTFFAMWTSTIFTLCEITETPEAVRFFGGRTQFAPTGTVMKWHFSVGRCPQG